ncbi:MAG: DUF2330 domain-containing protein [Actinomycetota bacterium]
MRRGIVVGACGGLLALLSAAPAWACAGLVGNNGAVNLVRTSTLAAYRNGVEHYVTSFEFAGGGAEFGSIVPLPGVPTRVIKGGDWTLQRLAQETQPQPATRFVLESFDVAAAGVEVIMTKRIDSLQITILTGGGFAVGRWAQENGFNLSPDAPEVLDFYARRSPVFMAARYVAADARDRGLGIGDGTPVHLVIPTPNPWVPLRILGLGKQGSETIEADVYLLTTNRPALLPGPGGDSGLVLEASEPASSDLLRDLRSDRGMKWLPDEGMWLSYLRVDSTAGRLTHDLAIDASGFGSPSPVAAGFRLPDIELPPEAGAQPWAWVLAALVALGGLALANRMVSTQR